MEDTDERKLYSLELDAKSYERLRRQEALLVDFSEFLGNTVWLLEQASSSSLHQESLAFSSLPSTSKRRFKALLREQQGKLDLLECNAFRELAHLTLPVQANSDRGMAKFLSFRLNELVQENSRLSAKVDGLEREGQQLRQALSSLQEQISADTSQHSSESSSWKIQCDMLQSQVINAKEHHEFLKEKARLAETAEVKAKNTLSTTEQELVKAKEEVCELRATVDSLEIKATSLEDIKNHCEGEVTRLKELCDSYKSASGTADARVEDWKRMAKSHEARATTIGKEAKDVEQKLTKTIQELSDARKRAHDSEERAAQRDKLMKTQEEALRTAQGRVSDLQEHIRELEGQVDEEKKQLEEAKKRESEASKKSENCEKMIVWLNKQLTSIQLSGGADIASPGVAGGKPIKTPTQESRGHIDVKGTSPTDHDNRVLTPSHAATTPMIHHPRHRSRLAG
jgi:chromosome segregation ATPase